MTRTNLKTGTYKMREYLYAYFEPQPLISYTLFFFLNKAYSKF